MMMPGLVDGFELAQLVLERWPSKKVLLTSGFSGGVGDKLEEQAMVLPLFGSPIARPILHVPFVRHWPLERFKLVKVTGKT